MSKKSLIIENAENGLGKIGLIAGDDTKIVLPMFYLNNIKKEISEITKEEKLKLKVMVKAWRKYQIKHHNDIKASGEDESPNYNFDVALSIIEDYVNNGLYTEFEKVDKLKKDGKIDFAKTIKKCKSLLTQQGPVYLSYISQVKKMNDEETIRSIQRIVVNSISREIGWLVGFNIQLPIEYGLSVITKKSIYDLNESRNNSFNTRKLKLTDLLIEYIKCTKKENTAVCSNMFVATAYRFWEEIIFNVFGNLTNKEISEQFYVRHAYQNSKDKKKIRVMDPLMPDAIYKDDRMICIIDAKYYSPNNYPTNDDISKQFIYAAKAVKSHGENYCYKNWFVMPTNKESKVAKQQVIFDVNISGTDEYSAIKIYYANMDEMILNYINDKKMDALII